MALKTHPFDPAEYLDSDEARAAYMAEALETDPALIADAAGVAARRAASRGRRVHDAGARRLGNGPRKDGSVTGHALWRRFGTMPVNLSIKNAPDPVVQR